MKKKGKQVLSALGLLLAISGIMESTMASEHTALRDRKNLERQKKKNAKKPSYQTGPS